MGDNLRRQLTMCHGSTDASEHLRGLPWKMTSNEPFVGDLPTRHGQVHQFSCGEVAAGLFFDVFRIFPPKLEG